jgi:hypothetical protein
MRLQSTAIVVGGAVTTAALVWAATSKRSVEMHIVLPNHAVAHAAAPEDESVIVKLVDGTRFGFVPTLPRGDDPLVVVVIWDVIASR